MIISGWGIFLIFTANQAATQIVAPYPPFGLATITVLVMASFLMLLGIYNSAILVSANNELRKSIYKLAVESRLLRFIGHAEMESEIERTVRKISRDKNLLEIDEEQQRLLEIDEKGLRNYLDLVIREVKKVDRNND
jgi:high-affinity nickel permease